MLISTRPDADRGQAAGTVLVSGATGLIGSHLSRHLIDAGVPVRLAARDITRLADRRPEADCVHMDVFRPDTVAGATRGVSVAYYLVHSMGESAHGFEDRDREAAITFARQARRMGVGRIVYLGGLGDDRDPQLSRHLASRHETGALLAQHGPPLIELRAGMVIGDGSASYQMLQDLVRNLPVMITPRWVKTRSQPIALDDVIRYLDLAREAPILEHHTTVEIGGADVLSYREMMQRVGRRGGREPRILPVPVLTPYLSSLWCGLVTSVPTSVARPLIEGQRNETIVRDATAARLFPQIRPIGFDEALTRAARMAGSVPAAARPAG